MAYFSHIRLVIRDLQPLNNYVSLSARSSVSPLSGSDIQYLSRSNSSPAPLHSFPNLPILQSTHSQSSSRR